MVLLKTKKAYQAWTTIHKNFPRIERVTLGQKIERVFLDILELGFTASYLPPDSKIILLSKTISRLDILKFFLQIAWENKLIPTEKYAELCTLLEEIGRMFGGWRRGLQTKTPATK